MRIVNNRGACGFPGCSALDLSSATGYGGHIYVRCGRHGGRTVALRLARANRSRVEYRRRAA